MMTTVDFICQVQHPAAIRVSGGRCDVTDLAQFTALYDGAEQRWQAGVDILCNNAGVNTNMGWRNCMDINMMAVCAGTELALARMSVEGGGRGGLIVNTASLAGIVHGRHRESYSYFAGKHAVVSLTRTLGTAAVVGQTGVRVQCLCPFFADTAIIKEGYFKALPSEEGNSNIKTSFDIMANIKENSSYISSKF